MTETAQVEPKAKDQPIVRVVPFEVIDRDESRTPLKSTMATIAPGDRQMFIGRPEVVFRANRIHIVGARTDGTPEEVSPLRLVDVQFPSLDAPEGESRASISINKAGPVVALPDELPMASVMEEIVVNIENRSEHAWDATVMAQGMTIRSATPYAASLGFRPTSGKVGSRHFTIPPSVIGGKAHPCAMITMKAPYLCRINRMRMRTDASHHLILADVRVGLRGQFIDATGLNVALFKDWFAIGNIDVACPAQEISLGFFNTSSSPRWVEIDLEVTAADYRDGVPTLEVERREAHNPS